MNKILEAMKAGASCEEVLSMVVDEADKQFKEVDRFFAAFGLHDESITIDDAICIVQKWKDSYDKGSVDEEHF